MTSAAEDVVNKLSPRIESFFHRHHQDPAVRKTFGFFSSHPLAPLNRKRLQAILNILEAHKRSKDRPLRVLDLGCGGGVITCALGALGCRAVGIDSDPEELRMARLFAFEETLDGMFLQAELREETPAEGPWEKSSEQILGGKPDAIVLAYVLHRLAEPGKLLDRLRDWVSPGTLLVINEENPLSPLFRLDRRVQGLIRRDTERRCLKTLAEWQALLASSGFVSPSGPSGDGPIKAEPPIGLDLIPGLGRFRPEKCWSLVFTAQRG